MNSFFRWFGSLLAASFVCATAPPSALGASWGSPVGTLWDCILNGGSQQGIAFLVFYDDGSFGGYQVLTAKPIVPSFDARYSGTPAGRTPEGQNEGRTPTGVDAGSRTPDLSGGSAVTPKPTPSASTNGSVAALIGFTSVAGPWIQDSRGKLTGDFEIELADASSGETNTNNNVTISFTGTVSQGRRIVLNAVTPSGRVTYTGVPYRSPGNFSGRWNATFIKDKKSTYEVFDLYSTEYENPFPEEEPDMSLFPGMYFTDNAQGAGHTSTGFILISTQKRMAMAFNSLPFSSGAASSTNAVLTAVMGSYSAAKGKIRSTMTGLDEAHRVVSVKTVNVP